MSRFSFLFLAVAGGLSVVVPLSVAAQSVRDSAGIRVATYASSQSVARWQVGLPTLRLGGREGVGAEEFFNVTSVVMLDDGSLVVGDQGSSELRFFDSATGAHLRSVGGEGRGPGEINVLWTVFRSGQEIVAVDASGAASLFDSEGSFQRRTPPPISGRGYRLERAGFFENGDALAYRYESAANKPEGTHLVSAHITKLRGDEPSYLMQSPGYFVTREGASRSRYLTFGPVITFAVFGERFCVGFPQRYSIDCLGAEGTPIWRTTRVDWEPTRVTREDREGYFRANAAVNFHLGADELQKVRSETEFARVFPAFGRFVVGAGGELWVGPVPIEGDTPVLHPSPREPTQWSVFSSEGEWIAEAELPAHFWLMSVSPTHLIGVQRDELDIEAVVLLPLQR